MGPALAALWRATVKAARAGTLRGTILDGIALATWAIGHPNEVALLSGVARSLGFTGDALSHGGSAAVESPAMERADGSHMGGA